MRKALLTDPKLVRISSALKADRFRTVGGIFSAWCLFDDQTEDGTLAGYTPELMDEIIGWPGLARAMEAVEWLEIGDGFLAMPRFDEHNGKSAKRRMQDAERKRLQRTSAKCPQNVRIGSGQKAGPEKRREESNTPQPPYGGESAGGDASTIAKIKSLRPRWGASTTLDAKDAREFRKNADAWRRYQPADWELVREFMTARLPDGSPYCQPKLLKLALSMPGSLLSDAEDWKGKQRPRLAIVPSPPATDTEKLSKAEVAAFLKIKP